MRGAQRGDSRCALGKPNTDDNVTLVLVAVDEKHRGKGIGSALIEEFVEQARSGGHPLIAGGAPEEVAGFLTICGFKPTLFVRS